MKNHGAFVNFCSSPDLERGGFVNLQGSYAFDYYLAMPILEGHAPRRWLERSFGPNRGKWLPDDEIRRNAEDGIVTMTLHNDGDSNGDGLFWRDGTYPPYPPEEMKKMEHVLKTCHEHGIKTLPYFSNHELHQSTAAFQQHGEEWGRKPDDQGNLRPDYFYGSHMCFKSGWLDFFKSYVDTVLKNQAFDGIYYDWNCALYCNNPRHLGKDSSGVSGDEGLATYACSKTAHWDVEGLLDLMEWTRERVGPEGLVTIHNTMVPMLAVENFADYVLGMEWGYGSLAHRRAQTRRFALGMELRRGALAGRHRVRQRGRERAGARPPPFSPHRSPNGHRALARQPQAAELFKVLQPLGDLERYQFEDWRNRAVKLPAGEDFLSAVYSRPGKAYVLLAKKQPITREIVCASRRGSSGTQCRQRAGLPSSMRARQFPWTLWNSRNAARRFSCPRRG